jgi:hypothetical protein
MARRCGKFSDLRYPVTAMLADMLAQTVDGTDFRPLRNGDEAAPAGAHSPRECGRAMTRRRRVFSDLWYPFDATGSTRPTLEHREAVVGRCPRRRKVCESVGERRCDVAGSLVTFPGCTDACTRRGVGGGLDRFSGIEKWCWDCAGRRECRRAMARRRRPCADLACFPVTSMHALILARAVDVTENATEK